MRGQRLFTRPIEPGDRQAILDFLAPFREPRADSFPAQGLLGKVVGELVAVLLFEIDDNVVILDDLVVANDFRKKRIGRFMIDELARIAITPDRSRIVVPDARGAAGFLQRVDFRHEDDVWVRRGSPK